MPKDVHIAPQMQARIEALSSLSGRSASEVVADALENGHSIEWQEYYFTKVMSGITAADRGEFASEAEIDRVRNKYRTA